MATNYLSLIPNAMAEGPMSQVSPVQWGQAMGQVAQNKMQSDAERNAIIAAQNAFKSRDPNEIAQLMITNPDIAERVSKGISFQNDLTRQNLIDSIEGVLANPNNAEQIIKDRISMVTDAGGDPSQSIDALAEYQSDPEGFIRNAEVAYSIYAPENYKAYASSKPKLQPSPEYQYKDGVVFNPRTGEATKTEFYEQIKPEEQKQAEERISDQSRIEEGIYQAEQNKNVINEFLNNDDYIDAATGFFNFSKVPEAARTTTQNEAAAYLDNIKNSMTIENLGVMSGPLTDKDIQIIASASSRLREGMSESALKKELRIINNAYNRVISNYQKEANRKGYAKKQEQAKQENTVNWSDL